MIICIPKEIKPNENRVGMTPSGVAELVANKHTVYVENGAGAGSGFCDDEYAQNGAIVVNTAEETWQKAELVIKVKEPLPSEFKFFRPGLVIFTFFHLAPEYDLTQHLLDKKVISIAYETIELADGTLPLLAPMSEVAGRMSVQIGATFLQKIYGGKGLLMGGVPGTLPAEVVIIGGGVVGLSAARIATGMGASVTIIDINQRRLAELDNIFMGRVKTLVSSNANIATCVRGADLLIGAVLVTGDKAPKLVSAEMVKTMQSGSVIVDVAIDQGGCVATIDRVTTHNNPVYEKFGIVHYSVANMPGAVPRTSTLALTSVTLAYVLKIANLGVEQAFVEDISLQKGLNTYNGLLTNKAVASSQNRKYTAY